MQIAPLEVGVIFTVLSTEVCKAPALVKKMKCITRANVFHL